MKKIFVTVAEFRRGGGSLKTGREIYSDDGTEIGLFFRAASAYEIEVDCYGINTFHNENLAYVQINCQPIYK